jgi:hypothetical protein
MVYTGRQTMVQLDAITSGLPKQQALAFFVCNLWPKQEMLYSSVQTGLYYSLDSGLAGIAPISPIKMWWHAANDSIACAAIEK